LKKTPAALEIKKLPAWGRKIAAACDQLARKPFLLAYDPVYFFNRKSEFSV
jgi:hypothetical protein